MRVSPHASSSQAASTKWTFHVLIQPDISCAIDRQSRLCLTHVWHGTNFSPYLGIPSEQNALTCAISISRRCGDLGARLAEQPGLKKGASHGYANMEDCRGALGQGEKDLACDSGR